MALSGIALAVAAGMLLIITWRGRMLLSLDRRAQIRNSVRIAFALCTVALLLSTRFVLPPAYEKLLLYLGGSLAFLWCCCPCCSIELPEEHTRELRRLYDMGAADAGGDSDDSRHETR